MHLSCTCPVLSVQVQDKYRGVIPSGMLLFTCSCWTTVQQPLGDLLAAVLGIQWRIVIRREHEVNSNSGIITQVAFFNNFKSDPFYGIIGLA
jgi:hypothetical protein